MLYLAGAYVLVNLIAFLLFGIDKRRAVRGRWRIPEKTLLLFCALFGAAGGFAGMKAFRHKTLKPRFRFGVPCLLVLEILAILLLCLLFGTPVL